MPFPSRSTGNPAKRPRPSNELKEEEPEERAVPVVATANDVPLIPKDCASARDGTESFRNVFGQRYCANGGLVPPFFIGSLQEAISEAFDKPTIAERRALALYIHHDRVASSRYVPKEFLCFDETIGLLRSNFVLWSWDVTAKENQDKLLHWLIECGLYSVLSKVAKSLAEERKDYKFPTLLLVTKGQDGLQLCGCVQPLDELPYAVRILTTVVSDFSNEKYAEIAKKAGSAEEEYQRHW